MKDYYYILGVKSNSTEKEIKSAYRKLSLKFHPDKNEGDKFFEERFKEINEAYEILGDIQKRKEYDSNSQNESEKEYSSNQESHEPEIVFFRVNKSSIKKGEILEISWETKFANSIKILPFGVLEASGTKKFKINGDDSFKCKILASNGNKVVSKEISITVTKIESKPTAPIILKFESDKEIVEENGFIELSWQTSNTIRVEIEGLGSVPLNGNAQLRVNFNRPVSITAHNEFGYISKSIKIYKKGIKSSPKSESNYSFLWIILIVGILFVLIKSNIKSEPKTEGSTNSEIDTMMVDSSESIAAKLQITNVKVTEEFTLLTLKYNNGTSGWININKDTYIDVGGQKLTIIESPQIPYSPLKFEFQNSNQDLEFQLKFPSLGDALYFDLVECDDKESCFNFLNVSVKRPFEANWFNHKEENVSTIGTVMFWTKIKDGGKFTVTLEDGRKKEISIFHDGFDTPVCGTKGFAIFDLKKGNYKYKVESQVLDSLGNTWNWEGEVEIKPSNCQLIELGNN